MAKPKAPSAHRSCREAIRDWFHDMIGDTRQNRSVASTSRSPNLPPSYEEAVASSRPPREASSVLKLGGMDRIVASAYLNQMHSPLIRLPDGLIVAIMERLDLDDILQLRQASRDFMRLFSQSKAFWKYHLTDASDHYQRKHLARIWATPVHYPRQAKSATLCDSCTTFRMQRGYRSDNELLQAIPFIYCSGCKMEHRAFYFSAQQRLESNEERLCKGREGRITLCEHISVTWDSAQRLADRKSGQNMIQCNKGHHKASPCKHVQDGTSKLCCHDDKPRFKFYRDGNQKLCFDISVTTHIRFKPQGSEQGGKLTSSAFRRGIKKYVHQRLPAPWFQWVPSNMVGAYDVIRCFDPNVCNCLDWGKPIPQRSEGEKTTTANEFEWKLCPNPVRPWRLRPDTESSTFTGKDEFHCEDRCAGFSHNHHFHTTYGSWDWEFEKCPENDSFMVFTQTRRSCVGSPHEYGWSYFINSRYRDLRRDEDMRGISWCSQLNCRFGAPYTIACLSQETVPHHRTI
ncbi:hypothetical protein B0J13DRAFT_526345 [Dactylonectria estremocensis]|uniref:F-box domain-containing protein n=1 Tax=Dactylonectria estremocensis TaxID=1079267 RepID=A0A9P9ESW5_9HYPO|nr:hypothetical protein B0J13DRAFT_526345 [Dactylonectria estremocensis]